MVMDLQYFGGRGSTSGLGSGRMSIAGFIKNFRNADEKSTGNIGLKVFDTEFIKNGNSVKQQSAQVTDGENKIVATFYSQYNPMQISKSNDNISSRIELRYYKNDNIEGYKVISEKKTKSIKNAKKNYEEVLGQWKKITKQKKIEW